MTDIPTDTAPHADDMPAGRNSRSETVTQERRRRQRNLDNGVTLRMEIPAHLRDDTKYAYRWVNDRGNRIHQLTVEDDWEILTDDGKALGEKQLQGRNTSTAVRYQVDVGPGGEPVYAFACRKPLKYFQQDQDEKVQTSEEIEAAIERGKRLDPESQDTTSYAVKGNKLSRSVRGRR